MPYRNPEQQRAFQRRRVAANRERFFAGKSCVDCGSTERLELDHVDRSQKTSHRIWSWAEPRRIEEIAKCVVRCASCHRERHALERRREHGAAGYKRGCRCEACRGWKREANARERARRLQGAPGLEPGNNGFAGRRVSHFATRPTTQPYPIGDPMPHLLMVIRNNEVEEAEPVVVVTDEPGFVTLVLDDGERLTFDKSELVNAALLDEAA